MLFIPLEGSLPHICFKEFKGRCLSLYKRPHLRICNLTGEVVFYSLSLFCKFCFHCPWLDPHYLLPEVLPAGQRYYNFVIDAVGTAVSRRYEVFIQKEEMLFLGALV